MSKTVDLIFALAACLLCHTVHGTAISVDAKNTENIPLHALENEKQPLYLHSTSTHAVKRVPCKSQSKKSMFMFGKCPEKCAKWSAQDAMTCKQRAVSGCRLVPCKNASGKFKCSFNPTKSSRIDTPICAGDKLSFNGANVKDIQSIKYKVDLDTNPLGTDIYLLIDATGSMSAEIAEAKRRSSELINIFGDRENVHFGVGMYRDELELTFGFKNLQSLTSNQSLAKAGINQMFASGGLDGPEANLVALYTVATERSIGWRERSRKIIVWFGDAPGHEPSCALRFPLTRRIVIGALRKKKISVLGVSFGDVFRIIPPRPGQTQSTTGFRLDQTPTPFNCSSLAGKGDLDQGTEITKRTFGTLVAAKDPRGIVDTLRSKLASLIRKYDVDTSSCDEFFTTTHKPSLPITLKSSEPQTSVSTLQLDVKKFCMSKTARKSYKCGIRYTESGADIGNVELSFSNIQGCS